MEISSQLHTCKVSTKVKTRACVGEGEKRDEGSCWGGFFFLMCVTEEEDLPERLWILDSLKELQGHCSGCKIITGSDPRLKAK